MDRGRRVDRRQRARMGARSTFALFYVAMLDEFAWGRGATAFGYSLSWLDFVVFAPVAGWFSDRWGTRTVVTGGGVILGVDGNAQTA